MGIAVGDKVKIIKRCGLKFSNSDGKIYHTEFYEEGEEYSVLELKKGHQRMDGKMFLVDGLKLREDAKMVVPFEAIEPVRGREL